MNFEMYVAGVGASAGGLQALQVFVSSIPVTAQTAYVIVQHLQRDHRSALAEILCRYTKLPVLEISDGQEIQPGTVHVMPAGKKLHISNGRLRLTERPEEEKINTAINHFFLSLAHELKNKAFGVILSGTGTDGVEGVKGIEDEGGIVLVQDPATASFPGMPANTIHLDHPDYVLPPTLIPGKIEELQKR